MTEEIKYYKEKEYPLKWIPAEEMEETPQQTIDRLEQENKELKDRNVELQITLNEFDRFNKYRSALKEIREMITSDNSMIIDKKVYFELQCGEPIALKLQKIYNKINEVLGNENN